MAAPGGTDQRGRPELGAPLLGQRVRDRAARPPVDPRLLRLDPAVGWLLGGFGLLSLLTAAALIAQATAIAAVVARTFLGGAALADHGGWLLLLGAAVAVRAATGWTADVLAQRTSARVKSRLRLAVLDRASRRTPGEPGPTTGELGVLLTDGVDALDGTFGGYLPALVSGLVVPLAIVGWVAGVDLTSAVVLAVTLPLVPLFMVLIGLAARAATRRRFRALTALSGHLLEVLQGLTTIRAVRATERVAAAVRDAAERLRRTTLETLRIAFLSALVLELVAALSVATVAVIAGVRLAQGTGATLEPVLVALLLAPEAFWPLRRVGQHFHDNEEGAAVAERLLDLAAPPPGGAGAHPRAPRRPAPDPARVPIRLDQVSVVHEDRPLPALDRVDLTLRPGEHVAVLGTSGAGKTTLAAVLTGLRAPDAGQVVVGSVPLRHLDEAAWHARVAWVPQQPADLAGTVRDLVAMGAGSTAPGAVPDAEVWHALRAVGMDVEVAGFDGGLDERLGPGARGVSAGQRRRLALARALVGDAGLVVLDEPTGDLDVGAERRVRGSLRALRGDRTVVVCTHRVALAADADRVVVLDEGRVVEDGPPGRLAARGGAFARLLAAAEPLREGELDGEIDGELDGSRTGVPAGTGRAAHHRPGTGPTPAAPPALGPPSAVQLVRELLVPHRGPLALAVLGGSVTPIAGVALVAVSTYLISAAALRPNLLDLTAVIVGVRALSLLKGVSRYGERLAGHDVALRVVAGLRTRIYARLAEQAPAGLARHRTGDVLGRVVGDAERVQLALVRGVVPLLGGAVAAAAIVVIAGVLLPAAAAVLAAGLLAAAVVVPALSGLLARRLDRSLAAARGQLAAEIVDVLRAAPELRLLGRLPQARDRVARRDCEVVRLDRSTVARGGGADASAQLCLGVATIGLLAVGVPAVGAGAMDGVLLGALAVLGLAAVEAVGPMPVATRSLSTALVAARRLTEILGVPPPTVDPPGGAGRRDAPRGRPAGRSLVHDGVAARYPGMPARAVQAIDLELARGRRVAVVGRSGAGKSTVALLSVRFLDAEEGEVRLDGSALTTLPGDGVRAVVALTPQRAEAFDGTIATNLRLADPDAPDGALWAALEAAQLAGWVGALPLGLDTPVGEGGQRLSGGQRHRLALARTLLTGAPLVVLDEPTADLDPVTGRAFLVDALRATGRRGVVILTHDLRPLPVADEVVVVEDGRVVGRGSHDALLSEAPAYAARWQAERAAT